MRYASFRSNVGMLVARQERSVTGLLCGRCFDEAYRSHQTTNWALGWWGVVSFGVTPMLLAANAFAHARLLRLPMVPEGADPDGDEASTAIRRGRAVEVRAAKVKWGALSCVLGLVCLVAALGAAAEASEPRPADTSATAIEEEFLRRHPELAPQKPRAKATAGVAWTIAAVGGAGVVIGGCLVAAAFAPPRRAKAR
jgi:hypothetical protein